MSVFVGSVQGNEKTQTSEPSIASPASKWVIRYSLYPERVPNSSGTVVVFNSCDLPISDITNLKEERVIRAHGFRRLSP